jgi:hypothetical protein
MGQMGRYVEGFISLRCYELLYIANRNFVDLQEIHLLGQKYGPTENTDFSPRLRPASLFKGPATLEIMFELQFRSGKLNLGDIPGITLCALFLLEGMGASREKHARKKKRQNQ